MLDFLNFRTEAERTASQIPDIKRLAVRTAFHILHGNNPQRRAGSGDAFWQFREYQAGDMPRDIDWRQSAKTDRVFIRQKEQHSAQTCLIWAKRNADMGFQSEETPYSKQKAAAVIALTLALLHARMGELVGFPARGRPGHSEKTLQAFEQTILESAEASFPTDFEMPKHAHFYAISDFLEDPTEIEAAFSAHAGRTQNGVFIHVLDPAEIALPYEGRVLFEDMNAQHRHLVSNAVDIREEYTERVQAQIDAVRSLCLKWGWQYVLHRTDAAFEDTLKTVWLEGARV